MFIKFLYTFGSTYINTEQYMYRPHSQGKWFKSAQCAVITQQNFVLQGAWKINVGV